MNVIITDIEGFDFNLEIRFIKIKRVRKKKSVIDTVCKIWSHNTEQIVLIADAIAWQSPKDNYNKVVGKKIALTKALQQIEFLKSIPEIKTINLHRKLMRLTIWQEFHATFKERS